MFSIRELGQTAGFSLWWHVGTWSLHVTLNKWGRYPKLRGCERPNNCEGSWGLEVHLFEPQPGLLWRSHMFQPREAAQALTKLMLLAQCGAGAAGFFAGLKAGRFCSVPEWSEQFFVLLFHEVVRHFKSKFSTDFSRKLFAIAPLTSLFLTKTGGHKAVNRFRRAIRKALGLLCSGLSPLDHK